VLNLMVEQWIPGWPALLCLREPVPAKRSREVTAGTGPDRRSTGASYLPCPNPREEES